jgi:hypothetical protein
LPFSLVKTLKKNMDMDDKELLEMLDSGAEQVQSSAPCTVNIQGRSYKVKQISQKVALKIRNLEKEILVLDKESQGELTLSRAKKIDEKMYTLHSKTAAYYLLGNWALFVPFLWALTWRWLFHKTNEVTFGINNAGSNHKDINFYMANWQITKVQLALSTKSVGEGIKQWQERMESAESMLAEDALPKKADNK